MSIYGESYERMFQIYGMQTALFVMTQKKLESEFYNACVKQDLKLVNSLLTHWFNVDRGFNFAWNDDKSLDIVVATLLGNQNNLTHIGKTCEWPRDANKIYKCITCFNVPINVFSGLKDYQELLLFFKKIKLVISESSVMIPDLLNIVVGCLGV